jgi:hypothetical protein
MSKTVSLPPVRIEPEHQAALERIASEMQPPVTVSALVRQSVVEYIGRHQVKTEWAEAAHLDDHEPLGVVPS